MISIFAAAIGLYQASAAEFFPSTPGIKWTYEQSTGTISSVYVDEIVQPVQINGKDAITIVSTEDTHVIDRRYYMIDNDTVNLVAYDPKKPLTTPHPILKTATKKLEWTFSGYTPVQNEPTPIKMKGLSTPKGKRKYLGEDHECLEVILEAEIELLPGQFLRVRQVATYAKGLGLVEMDTEEKVGKNTKKSKLKLLKFEASK